jgi:hypothetical protein
MLVAVTVTPGIRALVVSATIPLNCALPVWAFVLPDRHKQRNKTETAMDALFMNFFPPIPIGAISLFEIYYAAGPDDPSGPNS